MKSLNKREAMLCALCGRIGPDDGLDPRLERKERRVQSWKDLQVCKQASIAIAAEMATLRSLTDMGIELLDVRPDKGAKSLVITATFDRHITTETQALERLVASRGRLREAMARVQSRKRVPELSFGVVPREAVSDA